MGILGTAQMEAWYQKLLLSLNVTGPQELKFLFDFPPTPLKQYECKQFPLVFVPVPTCGWSAEENVF